MSLSRPLNAVFNAEKKKGNDNPMRASPAPIARGKPTTNTFICGTVLATIPRTAFIIKRVMITGAANFIPVTNIITVRSINKFSTFGPNTAAPRGTNSWSSKPEKSREYPPGKSETDPQPVQGCG